MFDEGFFILLALLGLFYLIGLPILVFVLFSRVRKLENARSAPEATTVTSEEPPAARSIAERDAQSEADDTKEKAGPWATTKPETQDAAKDAAPPEPRQPSWVNRFASWLIAHWVYAVSALSLALAGIFLVQYGVENGLLPPAARVATALAFGVALIGAGEWLRRKSGDTDDVTTAYLPSVFSGAGIVTLFGGILAARVLYDLIAPGTAFGGFAIVAAIALVLGWFYGPLLAAVGLAGGYAAPFILGGSSNTPETLLLYFGLLAILGLGIDTLRRWAWVSALTVILALGSAVLLLLAAPATGQWVILYAAFVAVITVLIPARSVWPDHAGGTILYSLVGRRKKGQPIFPVLLSGAVIVATTALIVLIAADRSTLFWQTYGTLCALAAAFAIWSRRATALQDQTLVPLLGALSILAIPDAHRDSLRAFRAERLPEAALPMDTAWVLAVAAAVTLILAWRSGQGRVFRPLWAIAAVTFLPAAGLFLEYLWSPAEVIGPYPWALQALAVAALMVFLAERFARADGQDRTRAALATMSALATVAFTFSILFTTAALTLAFAAVVVSAAALDRQFKLPLMEWFIMAGVAALSYRLVADPGLDWAFDAPFAQAMLAQGAAFFACLAGLWLLRDLPRPRATAALESGAWVFAGILISTALSQAMSTFAPDSDPLNHWSAGLLASVWLSLAMAQLHRLPSFKWLRVVLAVVFGGIGCVWLFALGSFVNPLLSREIVVGPPLLNSLIPAYLLPALTLALGAWKLTKLPSKTRIGMIALATLIAAVWATLVIRDFWQTDGDLRLFKGFTQPELYSYTLALLIVGGAIFYQSLARRSDLLRRAGLAVIALAIAKVFLVDISGLTGLIRVFSLLGLGLMLAGMAWVDRWARSRSA